MTSILIPQKLIEPWAPDNAWALVIRKEAEPNPLTEEGFLHYEARLVQDLTDATQGPADVLSNAFEKAIENLSLSLLGRMRLNRSINKALKVFADSLLEVTPGIAADHMLSIADDTVSHYRGDSMVSKSVQKQNAEPLFERHFLLNSNAMFHGAYLRDTMPKLAQKIVTQAHIDNKHLEHDERIKATTQALKEGLGKLPKKANGYWHSFSANALNNARTFALLNEFDSAEDVIAYRVKSVIDSITTNICRSLNGRVFPIKKALNVYRKFFNTQSLDEVQKLSPMVHGNQDSGFYTITGGKKKSLDASNYSKLVSGGIFFPPFHFNCRSTIVAVYGLLSLNGIKLREGAKDFERQAELREFEFHKERIHQAANIIKSIDASTKESSIKAAKDVIALSLNSFDDVLNFSNWKKQVHSNIEKLRKLSSNPEVINRQIAEAMTGVHELQSALWLRGNSHNILAFELKIHINPPENKGNKSDVDILTRFQNTIFNIQAKYGYSASKKANKQILNNLKLMKDESIFQEKDNGEAKNQRKLYRDLKKTKELEKAENKVVLGVLDVESSAKKSYNSKDIRDAVDANHGAWFVKNIDDLNSEIIKY